MPDIATVTSELEKMTRRLIPLRLQSKLSREDLVQEAWTRVLGRGGGEELFEDRVGGERRGYLRKTLRSVVVDVTRHYDRGARKVAKERSIGCDCGDGEFPGHELVSDQSTPSRRLSRSELLERLEAALKKLPEDHQRAIRLRHLEKLSMAETAELMGKSKPAVAGYLRKGLEELREELRGFGAD